MLYSLTCPDCQAINDIESEEPVTDWQCSVCKGTALSSLPTDEDNNLIEQAA